MKHFVYLSIDLGMRLIHLPAFNHKKTFEFSQPAWEIPVKSKPFGNYFAVGVSDNSKISYYRVNNGSDEYMTSKNGEADTGEVWDSDYRENNGIIQKPGKFISWLFDNLHFADDETLENGEKQMIVDKFCDGFRTKDYDLKIIDSASEVYDMDCEKGSNIDSCMTDCGEYYDLVDQSPSFKGVLCAVENNRIIGRALLWETNGESIKVMDRIYYYDNNVLACFERWAVNNGYYRKEYQDYDHKRSFICPSGAKIEKQFEINLKHCIEDYDQTPYMDTFTYATSGCDNLSNYGGDYQLTDTEGGNPVESSVYSDYEGRIIDRSEAVYCEYLDDDIHESNSVYIEHINSHMPSDHEDIVHSDFYNDWLYTAADSIYYSETDEEYYFSDDCTYCQDIEDETENENAIFANFGKYKDEHIYKDNAIHETFDRTDYAFHEDDKDKFEQFKKKKK